MNARITLSEIHTQAESLKRGGAAAECHYASMLLAILAPTQFSMDEASLSVALSALREAEANPTGLKIQRVLNSIVYPQGV
jgi:hypothetical protein